jgi:bifunctional non-homologous end joining protein LigD
VRIEPRWTFDEVRRAALALARDVERRAPALATSKWWKEERHGVFLDYNQNARDRTVASAYSVRPTPDARVSMPLAWEDVPDVEAADFTLATVPALVARQGDLGAGIDATAGSLDALLEGEPPRVQPSKRRPSAGAASPAVRTPSPTGRRRSTKPLLEISRAARREDALAGLERWKARHAEAAAHLEPADVLVDAMRGRSTTWTRIRVNLEHVPEPLRPPQEALDPDYDPWAAWAEANTA